MRSRPLITGPQRKCVRQRWLAALIALWVCVGGGEGRAATLSTARPQAPAARKHHCKCAVDCDGNCCCARRTKALGAAASPQDAATTGAAGPCFRSLPCDGNGVPAASPVMPVDKFADCVSGAYSAPKEHGAFPSQNPLRTHGRLAGARLDDPPEAAPSA